MKSFFNIHNLVKVKIESEDTELHEGYRHYLRYFETTEDEEVQYEVKDFNEYKEGGICFKKEKYALVYENNNITEYTTYANRATNLWLELLLVKKGITFVHSAAVEVNGKGIIFPALGGVGKTTLMSHLRKLEGMRFFGDDFVMLDKNGDMFSYPSDFSIYPYHLQAFPELAKTPYEKFLWKRKYFAFFYFIKRAINFLFKKMRFSSKPFLRGWIAKYIKVPASILIPEEKIGKKTHLYASVFLERYEGEKILVEEMTLDELVDSVADILKSEFRYGLPYLYALAQKKEVDIGELYQQQKSILRGAFVNARWYKIKLPKKLTFEEYFSYMSNFVRSIV